MPKSYFTVAQPAQLELVVDRSRFLGYCREVATETEVKNFLSEIRTQHPQATHHCYAWRLGSGAHPVEYYSDQGEPSGTAGKPILGAIQRLQLTNLMVVVVRYFGGKKLGIRGLIEAYGQAARLTLEKSGVKSKVPKFQATLTVTYADHPALLYRLQQLGADIISTDFAALITMEIMIPEEKRPDFEVLVTNNPC